LLEFRWNQTVAAIRGGKISEVASASCQSTRTSAIAMPTSVMPLTSAVTSPVWKNCDSESMSVVIRVITRPAISRSK